MKAICDSFKKTTEYDIFHKQICENLEGWSADAKQTHLDMQRPWVSSVLKKLYNIDDTKADKIYYKLFKV